MVVNDVGVFVVVLVVGNWWVLSMLVQLKFFYGLMDCGKFILVLQIDYNYV